uniref:Uncharacterized protein n=1 Tax=Setaria viridis TaxID=4556 RepID=A0A4U6T4P1_SETVI|nr:hypothetical protein SEVIR_9G444101v2 [Setaria viridis]
MTSCSLSGSASSNASESESDGSQSRTARGDGDGDGNGSVAQASLWAPERKGCSSSCSQVQRWPASRRRHLSRKSRHALDRNAGIAGRFPPNPTRSSSSPTSQAPPSSDHGCLPVSSSSAVQPRDQTSDAGVAAPPRATSGAIHAGVPRGPRGAASDTSLAAPKSASFAPQPSASQQPKSTFRPLTSPCTTPASPCRYRSAAATFLRTPRAPRSPRLPCLAAASAAVPPGTSSMSRSLVFPVSPSPR